MCTINGMTFRAPPCSLENTALDCLLRHEVMVRIFRYLIVVYVKFYGK